jgi:DNA end-binding protein Ku
MRAIWKGAVSFGLVSIPVNLYAATETKDIAFHQVHVVDGGRIQDKRICSVDGKEVPYSEVAKGYETPGGEMVIVTDDDLASLPVASSKSIEVREFIPLESIDPIYFARSYYLEPQKDAIKPYLLLRDALVKYGHVAIAKIALRQRERLAVLRVYADVILLNTMLWPDEVREPDFPFLREPAPQVRPQELALAGSLIDSLSDPVFDPTRYKDEYREALQALIEAKIGGREVTTLPSESAGAPTTDLMSALSASVEAAKQDRHPGQKPAETSGAAQAKGGAAKASEDGPAGGDSA